MDEKRKPCKVFTQVGFPSPRLPLGSWLDSSRGALLFILSPDEGSKDGFSAGEFLRRFWERVVGEGQEMVSER